MQSAVSSPPTGAPKNTLFWGWFTEPDYSILCQAGLPLGKSAIFIRARVPIGTGRRFSARNLRPLGDERAERERKPTMSSVQRTTPSIAALMAIEDDPFFDAFPPEMLQIREQVQRIVSQDVTLLLTGETGTGKTRLARLIHELSDRRGEPFLVIDCGAVSPSLAESEMFGHVQGAFTGADRDRPGKLAAARRGTLLLDEINSLPLPLQAKLLRAIDDRTFEPVGSERSQPLRARLMAATNVPLAAEVKAGRFRADLYFRINVVSFFLPPLRQRRASIAPLAHKFFTELAARNRPDLRGLGPEVIRALEAYPWPGNIRELRNLIERAVALAAGPTIELDDLPEALRRETAGGPAKGAAPRQV
jgi:transcriptional regulator with PAS, ATPase and Fis domain